MIAELQNLQKQLGIDHTFFIQFVVFFGFYLWLRFVFFKPYLKVVLARDNQTEGLKDESMKLDTDSARKESEYAEKISVAKKKAAQEREKILAEARAQSNKLVEAARAQAKTRIEKARNEAQSQAEKDLGALKEHAGALAKVFVEKLTKARVGL